MKTAITNRAALRELSAMKKIIVRANSKLKGQPKNSVFIVDETYRFRLEATSNFRSSNLDVADKAYIIEAGLSVPGAEDYDLGIDESGAVFLGINDHFQEFAAAFSKLIGKEISAPQAVIFSHVVALIENMLIVRSRAKRA